MYKITDVSITGFWQTYKAKAEFRDDVNIIIGKNGTGKTTFMNILYAVLAVDVEALYENSFHSVNIKLSDGKKTRTIRADKTESPSSPFPAIEYHISNKRYVAPLIAADDGRVMPPTMRRRALEEAQKIKLELNRLVSMASLSVYRISGDIDPEIRERPSRRHMSPVDIRLTSLTQRLTHYQLELSNQARSISTELQREVLTSILYKEEKEPKGYSLDFDENIERQKLITAYRQLGVSGHEITKRIQDHISAVTTNVNKLRSLNANNDLKEEFFDIAALEAYKLTSNVVEMSLRAEEKTKAIFSQLTQFISTLKGFISEKDFAFVGGDLVIKQDGSIPVAKLSSGEKQLLILFIEALLQKQQPYIFLADEPELSLHISWQRNIISAIRALNPNAQIIVATHSPEIAGKFRDSILDMGDILHA